MMVLLGKEKFTPLVNFQPVRFTFVGPLLNSSMYSSREFSEEGWYMISLMKTFCAWAGAENRSARERRTAPSTKRCRQMVKRVSAMMCQGLVSVVSLKIHICRRQGKGTRCECLGTY